ncbi:BrnT family toxin [Comamonas badia]|uniref:BrnT family toxin n=1 Tax=Comamonas badia TaxID=265291 RepID=UPI001FE18456|nr:BrnT family toxin [Comamonas badia]
MDVLSVQRTRNPTALNRLSRKLDTGSWGYNNQVEISYDAAKSERNVAMRGIAFDAAAQFDFQGAVYVADNRRDYGEVRWRALGPLAGRVHALVFTETARGVRVISLRKANAREVKRYEQATQA